MTPLSRQHHLFGSPETVVERHLKSFADGELLPEFTTVYTYDPEGNGLLYEKSSPAKTILESTTYNYDSEGTWISLSKQRSEGTLTAYLIRLRPDSNQIAIVDQKAKKTKISTYSKKGYKTLSVTQSAEGQIEGQETTKRNSANQKELFVVEKPAGNKQSETEFDWEKKGFQSRKITSMYDRDGDRVVITFDYPDTDETGNWLTRIATGQVHRENGETVPLPTETTRRSITYH